MRTPLVFIGATVVGVLVGCSFTTAGNFTECESDAECGAVAACSSGYCLSLPSGCRRENAGGSTEPFSEGNRIPIAALLPLTDSTGEVDDSELQGLNAMKLAISEANDNKGLSNRHFALFVCDTGRSDSALSQQLEWMVKNLQVPAVLTSGSGQTQEAAKNPLRIDAGTLIISATATSPALTPTFQREGNVWRISPPDTVQARAVVALVKADFPDAGDVRIDVVFSASDYGRAFGQPLCDGLLGAGYENTRHEYREGVADSYANVAIGLTNGIPRATVLIGFPPDVREVITRAQTYPNLSRTDGGHRWYLTDAAKDPAVLTPTTRGPLEGSLGTAPAQGAGGAFTSFRDSFRGRYNNTDPLTFSYTSHSYDATWLVMLSAAWASQGGATITGAGMGEGMRKLQVAQPAIPLRADKWIEASNNLSQGVAINVDGTSGALEFDLDAGAATSPYEVWQVVDGGIRVVRLLNP